MKRDAHLSAVASAIRNGTPIPSASAAVLEARGVDLCALIERHQNS